METGLILGNSVLDGALDYAKSVLAEEVALQLGIHHDHAFIRDELEMMQAFLRVAHNEGRDDHEVLMTWVKQVRDVAYDAEDCLQDFAVHLHKPSWWRLPCTLQERRRIAKQMKELRARVEDVSQRNLRYQLIKSASSKPATTAEQSSITAAAIFGIDEARRAAKQDNSKVDLVHLVNMEDEDLRVIAVWGTSGDLGLTSIINTAYENPDIKGKFSCRAWVRILPPFNPNDFIQSLVKQFRSAMGVDILLETEKTGKELADEFNGYLQDKSYLIVLNGLSTFEEWNLIKSCLPNHKKGSRIIVCSLQVEVASLCAGKDIQVLELKQLSADQTIYAFYGKDSEDGIEPMKAESSSNSSTTTSNSTLSTTGISGNQSEGANGNNAARNNLNRIWTTRYFLEESQLIGRDKEKSDIMKLILNQSGQELPVISVWGMGGLGKTTLVIAAYQSQDLSGMFEKRACVTLKRQFVLEEFLRTLVMQLDTESSGRRRAMMGVEELLMKDRFGVSTRRSLAMMGVDELIREVARLLERRRCLIVLDDLSSSVVWDLIIHSLPRFDNTSRIIVTTREENVAKHCSSKQENVYKLKVLQYKDALDLFTEKVFKETTDLDNHPELISEAKAILKKCNGLPLALVTIGGFLANQPKTILEWRKLNKHISTELEMNPELGAIKSILRKSYDGLPYHLKSCFLYISIFPEDHEISWRRLVRRWIAEGYSREIRDKSVEEVASSYLKELIDRSMILPSQQSIYSRKGIDSCRVHDLMREIGISKSTEENLVFRLEEGCSSNTQGIVRHLAISGNWKGDKSEIESMVDLSRVRSLTIFGMVRPFFISEKMKMLRVLDLEHTKGLVDHHLQQIGEFYHLKYLSLRGCGDIYYLPESLGNLWQLQTLDIAFTNVLKLPKSFTRLTSLQYFCAGSVQLDEAEPYEEMVENMPMLVGNRLCLPTLYSLACCVVCCAPHLLRRCTDMDGEPNRHDVCTVCCCNRIPLLVTRQSIRGVQVPKGIRKLKALHAMGLVNLAQGKKILNDIKRLTRLQKLAVTGICRRNARRLCSAIDNLSNLESLLLRAEGTMGLLGCLLFVSSPPENLQSLKLYGTLGELPPWIGKLQNLVKLTLRSTRILDINASDTIDVLGRLPNLTILRLLKASFLGHEVRLSFVGGAFSSLMVMEFDRPVGIKSVGFQQGAMPKLELLDFCAWRDEACVGMLTGLSCLTSLKKFTLNGTYDNAFVEDLRTQLASNPNRPDFHWSAQPSTKPAAEEASQSV